jgi:hypothetical protein
MLVPLVKTPVAPQNNLAWYIKRQLEREHALPAESVVMRERMDRDLQEEH